MAMSNRVVGREGYLRDGDYQNNQSVELSCSKVVVCIRLHTKNAQSIIMWKVLKTYDRDHLLIESRNVCIFVPIIFMRPFPFAI